MKRKRSKDNVISNDVEYAISRLMARELQMQRKLEVMKETLSVKYGLNYAQSWFYILPKHDTSDHLTDKFV